MAIAENGSAGEANNGHAPDHFVEKLDEKKMTESNPSAAEGKGKEQSSNIEDEEHESGRAIILENTVDGGRDEAKHPSSDQDYVDKKTVDEKGQQIEDRPLAGSSPVDVQKQVILFENGHVSGSEENTAFVSDLSTSDKSKQVKSVRSSPESNTRNGSVRSNEDKDTRLYTIEKKNLFSDSVVQHLENRIKNLEGELREAAAIEISLSFVVAEHGSSTTKVHAPSRRLSRLYFHARRQNPNSRRGNTAKSIVSGLVLVTKACGNDFPRLTLCLSNSIVLRVIMSKSLRASQLPTSIRPVTETLGDRNRKKKTSPLKWESFPIKGMRSAAEGSVGDWENPLAFSAAIEKVEMWIFSWIIEFIWWQLFSLFHSSGSFSNSV
ncbi:uncharacterized protein [Primulina eburnea]|uniref:uncharacterized protein n=1 Tax=Primulina eburnea TaxID=1245227 RepID=UPI003C6CB092